MVLTSRRTDHSMSPVTRIAIRMNKMKANKKPKKKASPKIKRNKRIKERIQVLQTPNELIPWTNLPAKKRKTRNGKTRIRKRDPIAIMLLPMRTRGEQYHKVRNSKAKEARKDKSSRQSRTLTNRPGPKTMLRRRKSTASMIIDKICSFEWKLAKMSYSYTNVVGIEGSARLSQIHITL